MKQTPSLSISTSRARHRRNQGIALITVVSVLALMTILTVAMFSVSQTELASSNRQTYQDRSRELADTAVNVVMDQIWQGTKRKDAGGGPVRYLWASQPGAIRRYYTNGIFESGYRLYSSTQMVVRGTENQMIADATPANWNDAPARYVDLNEPVIRPASDVTGRPSINFPILDPRAYVRGMDGTPTSTNVEGFYYSQGVNGVVDPDPAALEDLSARLPMPVEWLYALRDGTLGVLNNSNQFIKPNGALLSAAEARDNPIVGRVAFWTDDESCKLNINTASEPTYWSVPSVIHERDFNWAFYQPTAHEYQRYPGHPATVALSTVMFPNQDLDLYGKAAGSGVYKAILKKKESIYKLAPKVNFGGSRGATVPYWMFADNYSGPGGAYKDALFDSSVSLEESIKERLYASVDELYFEDGFKEGKRTLSGFLEGTSGTPTGDTFFAPPGQPATQDRPSLERLRFFLTAHSRMPETNMFGQPRVAIWPVADEGGLEYRPGRPIEDAHASDFRTGFDELIAFCSTLGKPQGNGLDGYFFRRKCAYSPIRDVRLPRNDQLLRYLFALMEQRFPGGASFKDKYPDDYKGIIVKIFDYIRSTNTYDGFLAPTKEDLQKAGSLYDMANSRYATRTGEPAADGNIYRNRPRTFRTFTYDRGSINTSYGQSGSTVAERQAQSTFPGHGMVVPTRYSDSSGEQVGFGRFVAVAEAGFHFICTADGEPDKGSFRARVKSGSKWIKGDEKISGGRTALRIQRPVIPTDKTGDFFAPAVAEKVRDPFLGTDEVQVWYSNYPPLGRGYTSVVTAMGAEMEGDQNNPNSSYYHPACNAENWNYTLDLNTPLQPGQRRVQGMLALKLTMTSPGFTVMNPDFCIVVKGLEDVMLDGQRLFPESSDTRRLVWKSNQDFFSASACRPIGGSAGPHAMAVGRRIAKRGAMPMDVLFVDGGDEDSASKNLSLVTNFLTVNKSGMRFTGGPVVIEVYGTHDPSPDNLVQTIDINMPMDQPLPTPELVTLSSVYEQYMSGTTLVKQAPMDAPHWWAFNYCGALRRSTGNVRTGTTPISDYLYTGPAGRTLGRFFTYPSMDRASVRSVPRGASTLWAYEPTGSGDSGDFGHRLLNPSDPLEDSPSDQHADTGLVDTQPNPVGKPRDSRGQDTMFTMVPKHGDMRMIAGRARVPASEWVEHPRTTSLGTVKVGPTGAGPSYKQFVAHNMTRFYLGHDAGYDRSVTSYRIVPNAPYNTARMPDLPPLQSAADASQRYGDFDNAMSGLRDGPYINKPDEGNTPISFYGSAGVSTVRLALAYAESSDYYGHFSGAAGQSFMSPNRMIPSPGMFGSLPTTVMAGDPWRTLLFRPNMESSNVAPERQFHPGAAAWQGGVDPADHFVMDLFWMPVVEPYAISEPFSTAGKVNINYQIVPFRHIRRATGIHAVLKGEMLKAIPTADAGRYLVNPAMPTGSSPFISRDGRYSFRQPWTDMEQWKSYPGGASEGVKYWHRNIEVEQRTANGVLGTLLQFENRFNFAPDSTANPSPPVTHGLFRTASQICEVHLIPRNIRGSVNEDGGDSTTTPYTVQQMNRTFWSQRLLTGDNTRERPYANIYGKITTQSNTFRVHYRSQTIKKARSSQAEVFDPSKDAVLTDYRGSTLIERRIDPSDSRIPDYAGADDLALLPSLEDFYRFRVLEVKRFLP